MGVFNGELGPNDAVRITAEIIAEDDIYSDDIICALLTEIPKYGGSCRMVKAEKVTDYRSEEIKIPGHILRFAEEDEE